MQNLKDFTVGGVNFNAITIPKLYNQLTNRNNQTKGYVTVSGASGVVESHNSKLIQ